MNGKVHFLFHCCLICTHLIEGNIRVPLHNSRSISASYMKMPLIFDCRPKSGLLLMIVVIIFHLPEGKQSSFYLMHMQNQMISLYSNGILTALFNSTPFCEMKTIFNVIFFVSFFLHDFYKKKKNEIIFQDFQAPEYSKFSLESNSFFNFFLNFR